MYWAVGINNLFRTDKKCGSGYIGKTERVGTCRCKLFIFRPFFGMHEHEIAATFTEKLKKSWK